MELCTWRVEQCSNEIKVPSYSVLVVALLSPEELQFQSEHTPHFVLKLRLLGRIILACQHELLDLYSEIVVPVGR